jgi:mono/diheme cytochrome c family protein
MQKKRIARTLLLFAVLFLGGAAAFFVWAWRLPLPAQAAGQTGFDPAQIAAGAQLAAIGNCNVCHTKEGGAPYAGGRPIATPFGTIHTTNITPNAQTGIGDWSLEAFARAMREGVSRDGRHLYPAFPYDHMTKMRDGDIQAVYAFIMTRRPVAATAPANDLAFPLNIRLMVAGWKLLFLDRSVSQQNPAESAELNRGAYLVEGLGHCGACHTPRNVLGAEKTGQAYAGGESDGWIAPALDAASPAAVPWNADRLYSYLRNGFDPLHGIAAGPMAPVARNLATVAESDVQAMAVYVAAVAGSPSAARQAQARNAIARSSAGGAGGAPASDAGAAIYSGACAQCHGEAGRAPAVQALNLALSSTLRMPGADNAIRIVRNGIRPADGGAGPIMPGFADVLTDAQLISLATYLRAHFAERPGWTGIEETLRQAKQDDAEKLKRTQRAEGTR